MTKETAIALATLNNQLISWLVIDTYQLLVGQDAGLDLPDQFRLWMTTRMQILEGDGYATEIQAELREALEALKELQALSPKLLEAIQDRHPDFRFPWQSD